MYRNALSWSHNDIQVQWHEFSITGPYKNFSVSKGAASFLKDPQGCSCL